MKEKINTAIIGFGLSGRVFHSSLIESLEEFNLSKIYTTNNNSQEYIRKTYKNTKIVEDIEHIFNDKSIELVVISVPNKFHFELSKKALKSNKNVIVEKPFTVTSNEADELIQLSEEKNKILTVYQNRRWDSDFRTITKIVNKNWLGNLVEYEAHFDRFRNYFKNKWKEKKGSGSGILYDLGSHLIDQAQCLFGTPNEIFADIRTQRLGGEVDDNFEIILYYNNLKVTLKAGMLVKEELPRYILLGDKGSYIKYGMDIQEEELKKEKKPNETEEWGKESENQWGIINTEIDGINIKGKVQSERGDYREFYKNVYKAIVNGEELEVKAKDVRNTIRLIELAIESNQNKKIVKFR